MNSLRGGGSIGKMLAGRDKYSEHKAVVVHPGSTTCDVRLSNGTVLRNVRTVGATTRGQAVDVAYTNGRAVVYGGTSVVVGTQLQVSSNSSISSGGGGGGGATPGAHNLSDTAIHLGTLGDGQAPQFLKVDGTRSLTGDMAVNSGIKIDGYDIDGQFILIAAQIVTLSSQITALTGADYLTLSAQTGLTNERVLSPTNIGPANAALTGFDNGAGSTYQLRFTSSSYPGATPQALASDATGGVGVQRLGVGTANDVTMAVKSSSLLPSGFAGQLMVGSTTVYDAQFAVTSTIRSQFRIGYDNNNYMEYTVSSTGSATIFATGDVPQDAHIYLATAGGVSVGAGAPQAKLHIMSNTLPLFRAGRDAVTYMQIEMGTNGIATLSTSAAIPSNSHLILAPGGNVGIGTGNDVPGGKFEIRSSVGPQIVFSYDNTVEGSITMGSGGNVELLTYGSDFTFNLQPIGGLAGTKAILPKYGYDISLGRIDKKFNSINAAEIIVQTLVAFETAAVAGGHLMVVPSSPLKVDVSGGTSGSTTTPLDITHVASASGTVTTADANWYLALPGGWAVGDVIVAVLATSAQVTATAPLGWTQFPVNIPRDWQGTRRLNAFYRVLQAGDAGPYGFNLSATAQGSWTTSIFHNTHSTQPLHVSDTVFNSASSTSMTAPTLTTTTDKCMIVMVGLNNNAVAVTPPAGMTKLIEVFEGNSFNRIVVFDAIQNTAGSTGSLVATNGGAAQSAVLLLTLRPNTVTVGGTADTTFRVKHNHYAVGDIIHMEANFKSEWMSVLSAPTGTTGDYTMVVSRNLDNTGANDWYAGDVVVNTGQVGQGWVENSAWWTSKGEVIEYIYTITGSTWSSNRSLEPAWTLFGSTSPAAGAMNYYGMGGGKWSNFTHYIIDVSNTGFTGAIEFWNGTTWTAITGATSTAYNSSTGVSTSLTVGNLPATPSTIVVAWNALTQAGWTRNTVNGVDAYWVRWRVSANASGYAKNGLQRALRGSAQYGPSVTIFVRDSNTYNDYSARAVFGNLHGQYDYGKLTYGFAAGKFSASTSWVSVDADNGIRIMRGTAKVGTWANDGTIQLWSVSTGQSMIRLNADGSGYVGGGNVSWDGAGNTTITAALQVRSNDNNSWDNILYNSSFDVSTLTGDGWAMYNDSAGLQPMTETWVGLGGADGGAFIRLNWTVNNTLTKGISANVGTVKGGWLANQTYVVSFYAKASSTNVGKTMELRWNTAPTTVTTISNPALTTSWQRYVFKIVWGASVDTQIFISIALNSLSVGNLDLDMFQAERSGVLSYWKPSNDELLPGTVQAVHINVGSLSAISADLGTIYAGEFRLGNQDANTYNASTFTGLRMVKVTSTTYRFEGVNAGTVQVYFDTDGSFKFGGSAAAGPATISNAGIKFDVTTDAWSGPIEWRDGSNRLKVRLDGGWLGTTGDSFFLTTTTYTHGAGMTQAPYLYATQRASGIYWSTDTKPNFMMLTPTGFVPGSGIGLLSSSSPAYTYTATQGFTGGTYYTAFANNVLAGGIYLVTIQFDAPSSPFIVLGSGIISILSDTNAATTPDTITTLAMASHTANINHQIYTRTITGTTHVSSGLQFTSLGTQPSGTTVTVKLYRLV